VLSSLRSDPLKINVAFGFGRSGLSDEIGAVRGARTVRTQILGITILREM
jgi:hypothetical protein